MPKKPSSAARRFYDAAYKLQAVRKVREQQLSVRAVCQDLQLSESILRRWLATYDAEQSGTAPSTGRPISPEQQRIRQLEKENNQLKQDVAILKKGSAFFARELA